MKSINSPILFTIIVLILSAGVVIAMFVTRQIDEKTDIVAVDNATANNNNNGVTNMNIASITNAAVNLNKNSNSEIDSSDWLTYINEVFGFSFEYPSDWQFSEVSKDKFCLKEDIQFDGSCTNGILSIHATSPSKSSMFLRHAGNNEDNLTVNEWRQEVDGRNGELKYEVDMGDFVGYELNEISENNYQTMSIVYFTTHQQVFYIEWYDQELRDEEGYKIYIEILKSFRQNSY